jgi:hypothetical protein
MLCPLCKVDFEESDLWETDSLGNDICEDCGTEFDSCDDCSETFHVSQLKHKNANFNAICEECSDQYWTCGDCGEIGEFGSLTDPGNVSDGEIYCENCWSK